MANSALISFLQTLLRQSSNLLLLSEEISVLDDDERRRILAEFGRGRQHLYMTFKIKLSHWRQLPWIAAGISHADRGVAEACGARTLRLYATATETVRVHPLVHALCHPESPVHAELLHFLNHNADLENLPLLAVVLGKLLFMPVAERWIESQHATAGKFLQGAPHYSCVHLAWRGIQSRLQRILDALPSFLTEFSEACMSVRNPRKALVRMGFWPHPGVQQKLQKMHGSVTAFGRTLRSWVVDLLYHCDNDTVYQDWGGLSNRQVCRLYVGR